MNKLALSLAFAFGSLLAANGFAQNAQSGGVVEPDQSKALPSKPATAAEKAAGKQQRKAEGAAAVKENRVAIGDDRPTAGQQKVSAEEKKVAAAKRKADATAARKAGETQKGEGK